MEELLKKIYRPSTSLVNDKNAANLMAQFALAVEKEKLLSGF